MKPSELYSSLVEAGKLSFDEEQSNLLAKLDGLGESLESSSRSWFGRKKVKGLYIKGEDADISDLNDFINEFELVRSE